MQPVRPQTSAELATHLREQLAFLRTSAAAYDAGTEIEAKRLAVVLRTLLHDTGSSVSLLNQLGIKSTLRFYDRYADGQGEKAKIFVGVGMTFAAGGLKYIATFTEPSSASDFETYWNGIAIKEGSDAHRRRDVILGVANQDGGAHIDPSLVETYARLSRDFTSPWTVTVGGEPGTVLHGPQLPIVRQCAFEVELTLVRQLPALLGGEAW